MISPEPVVMKILIARFWDCNLTCNFLNEHLINREMKKLFISLSAAVVLSACGGEDKSAAPSAEQAAPKTETPAEKPPTASTEEKALELIATKGCTACHALDKKIIGPAYIDVSKKYEATPEMLYKLTQKVVAGGKGAWGEIPMPPNKNITFTEAKMIVAYILSLKNQ